MNKSLVVFFAFLICIPLGVAVAADGTVADRAAVDCTAISNRIGELTAIANPDDATATELANLQNQYRTSCARAAAGRRASGRVSTMSVVATTDTAVPVTTAVETATAYSVLTNYLTARRTLCDGLTADISALEELVAYVNSLDLRAYTLDSVVPVNRMMSKLTQAMNDEEITQEKVDELAAEMQAAIDGLQPNVIPETGDTANGSTDTGSANTAAAMQTGMMLTLLAAAGVAVMILRRKRS